MPIRSGLLEDALGWRSAVESKFARSMNVYGVTIVLGGGPVALLNRVADYLRHVPAGRRMKGSRSAIEVIFDACRQPVLDRAMGPLGPGAAGERERVVSPHACEGVDAVIDHHASRVLIRPAAGRAVDEAVFVTTFFWCLQEAFKPFGIFYTHAACVCRSGRAILLSGRSGCGKSTMALRLAERGFTLLADDVAFMVRGRNGLEMLAFPQPVGLRRSYPQGAKRPGGGGAPGDLEPPTKEWVPVAEAYGSIPCGVVTPHTILFPQLEAVTGLVSLTDAEAFSRLLQCSIVPLTDRLCRAHLKVLRDLVAASESFAVNVGSDSGAAAELVTKRFRPQGRP